MSKRKGGNNMEKIFEKIQAQNPMVKVQVELEISLVDLVSLRNGVGRVQVKLDGETMWLLSENKAAEPPKQEVIKQPEPPVEQPEVKKSVVTISGKSGVYDAQGAKNDYRGHRFVSFGDKFACAACNIVFGDWLLEQKACRKISLPEQKQKYYKGELAPASVALELALEKLKQGPLSRKALRESLYDRNWNASAVSRYSKIVFEQLSQQKEVFELIQEKADTILQYRDAGGQKRVQHTAPVKEESKTETDTHGLAKKLNAQRTTSQIEVKVRK
jgi:hypothetical protein